MHPSKPLIRIRHLLAVMLAVGLLSSLVMVAAQAADPLDIETAIDKGVEALVGLQNGDGSWGDPGYAYPHLVATTCFALVKLQERAYELNDPEIENPFDPDYEYSGNVTAGWQFVLNAAEILQEAIPVQNAGDPDVNGNGYGLDFATAAVPSERYGYTQGICLMALASTGTPSRPNDGGLDFNGVGGPDTYLELAQEVAEHIAYGQVDFGSDRGGWHYASCNNGACAADNSVTGYTVLGLAYAEAFGVNLTTWVKPELNVWINSVQNADGGSMYSPPSGSSNILRTGNLIFEMSFVDGAGAPGTARFQNALAYIENNWHNTGWTWGWGYSLATADYQAMYTLMKGLEYSDIDLIDTEGGGGARDDDWFNQNPPRTPAEDFASVLVQQQDSGTGLWPSNCHQYGCQTLCQIWALLILEKAAPPPPVPIEVSKHWSYTNVCFEKDNDNDGEFNEDPVNFEIDGITPIDDDGDGLYNEDDVDCPMGTYLGDELPMDGDNYVLEAVIHPKNNKVKSYNPGQYYAVSTVNVTNDVEVLTIEEDWSDCCNISVLNPKKGGGSVVIVQVGPGDAVAYQIFNAKSDAIAVNATACTATATLEDVKAGTTILMYVKFGPALKGETWEPPNEEYYECMNSNSAWVGEDGEPKTAWAKLILGMKD